MTETKDETEQVGKQVEYVAADGTPKVPSCWMYKGREIKRSEWDAKFRETYADRIDKLFAQTDKDGRMSHGWSVERETWLYHWLSKSEMVSADVLLTFLETNWTCLFFVPFGKRAESNNAVLAWLKGLPETKDRSDKKWMRFRLSGTQPGALATTSCRAKSTPEDDRHVHDLLRITDKGEIVLDGVSHTNLSVACMGLTLGNVGLIVDVYGRGRDRDPT